MRGGTNEYFFAKKYKDSQWTGLDIDTSLFDLFHTYGVDMDNVNLLEGDWFNMDEQHIDQFDGVISLQSLSWLCEWQKPLLEICKIKPAWIAFSSLFYEGNIEYIIQSYNYERSDEIRERPCTMGYYNIYSIPRIREFLAAQGYTRFEYEPFHIDIDLPKPKENDWGTYTVKTEAGERLQISAAMLMPWYFIYASKE